jgi:hypothetical protein
MLGGGMQKQWQGQNVDLKQLSVYAEEFFKTKGYMTRMDESDGEYVIKWIPPRVDGVSKSVYSAVELKISGSPDDFTIDIFASEATRSSIRLGLLTSALGGGYFTLQGNRLRETLERLENEFWIYIEEKVALLARQSR